MGGPTGNCRVPNGSTIQSFAVSISVSFKVQKVTQTQTFVDRCGRTTNGPLRQTTTRIPAGGGTFSIRMVRGNDGNFTADQADVAAYNTGYDAAITNVRNICEQNSRTTITFSPPQDRPAREVVCVPAVPEGPDGCTPAIPAVMGTFRSAVVEGITYSLLDPKIRVTAGGGANCRMD
jgi:hypothetical protein